MEFINSSILKFSPDFQNTEEVSRGDLQEKLFSINQCCDEVFELLQQWFKAGDHYMQVYSSLHANHTPSQQVFK